MTGKTTLRLFIRFTLTATAISMILLVFDCIGFACIIADTTSLHDMTPQRALRLVSQNLTPTQEGYVLGDGILPQQYWCILVNDGGDVIWSQNMPDDIPGHYSLQDMARITRWFLNDYPVYISLEDYGILILGEPKKAVGKYQLIYYMEWFETLPRRILAVFLVNLCMAVILALILGANLYRKLRILINGMNSLRREKQVYISERGIFHELYHSINETSNTLAHKNAALAVRDNARARWISGISHDIRTPLSVITGCSEELASCAALSPEDRKKAETITAQSIKIRKLVSDFNLISSLEYDMQPSRKKKTALCPLLRQVTADLINSGLTAQYEISLDLHNEGSEIRADEALLERALFNLLSNSILHNPEGCRIRVAQYERNNLVCIEIQDDGCGVPPEVLENIRQIPRSTHGMGLPMAYRIIQVHGGSFTAENDNGFRIRIELPKEN